MAVDQLRDGRWIVHYRKGTNPEDPKRTREYFGRGDQGRIAAEIRNSELGFSQRKHKEKGQRPTFGDIALEWQRDRFFKNSQTTLNERFFKFRAIILPELGHVPIALITPARLDQYVVKRLKTPVTSYTGPSAKRRKRKLYDADGNVRYIKKSTVNRELKDILAIMSWAMKNRKIAFNPCSGYQRLKSDDAIIRPPSPEEVQSLIKLAPPHLVRVIILSWYTGVRPGTTELFRLKWEDVDWSRHYIFIRSAEKGGPKRRPVPIDEKLLSTLRKWHEIDGDESDYIITWQGKPIRTIYSTWKTTKAAAGIKRRLRPYDLRHAFVTYLLEDGADLKSVSSIVGHSNTVTTTQIYQHINMNMMRSTIAKVPAIEAPDNTSDNTPCYQKIVPANTRQSSKDKK